MPDPERVVRRSLSFLRRLGLAERPALDVIIVVADRTWLLASEQSHEFRDWLEDIRRIAVNRAGSLDQSHTDTEGDSNADR